MCTAIPDIQCERWFLSFDMTKIACSLVVIFSPEISTNCAQLLFKPKVNNPSLIAPTSAHVRYQYRSCLCLIIRFVGTKNFFSEVKIIFSSPQNKLSGVNKPYINIGNGQKQKAKVNGSKIKCL